MGRWNVRDQAWTPTPREDPATLIAPWKNKASSKGNGNAGASSKFMPPHTTSYQRRGTAGKVTESPLEPELQECIKTFKAAHPGGIWTPRKVQGSPRREIWGLAGSRKCLPVASKQEPIRAQPYEPPPPPAPMKKAMELRPAYVEEEELHRRAEQLLAEAQQLENARPTPSLQVKLGTILLSKDDYIKKVLKDWDKGKGEFLKGEFRINLRSIGLVVTSNEADDLFDTWDDDKGGSLDMKELKRALQQTQQAAKAFHNTPDTSTDKANTRYALAKLAQEAAEATAEAVELEKAHRRHVNGLASRADIQLGALLYKRQIKPAVIVATWSGSRGAHAGELSKQQFTNFCVTLGLPACITIPDVKDTFDQFDEDKGGYMDVGEAKMMIRGLLEKAEIEEKKGRSMERDAQQMRAKATKLATTAMAPLDEESDHEPPESNDEEKPPAAAPSKARTGKLQEKARLGKGPIPDDEEARAKAEAAEAAAKQAVRRFLNQKLAAGFSTWHSWWSEVRDNIHVINEATKRWSKLDLLFAIKRWASFAEEGNMVICHYKQRAQALALLAWMQSCKVGRRRLQRNKLLRRLVHGALRRFAARPQGRRLIATVFFAWKFQVQYGENPLSRLCLAVTVCLQGLLPRVPAEHLPPPVAVDLDGG